MELLVASRTPSPAGERLSGFHHPANFRLGSPRMSPPAVTSPSLNEDSYKVFVAVGKSVGKASDLLYWTFKRFGSCEICILHVHQPSPFIPTLLGKLPASQANDELVTAYRREEREQMEKLLLDYLSICHKSKVKASVVTTESHQISNGIVDLVNEHSIRTLVIGAVSVNWLKAKKNSRKNSYAAENAPSFCEIWFIKKGIVAWTREASQSRSMSPKLCAGTIMAQAEANGKAVTQLSTICTSNENSDSPSLRNFCSPSSGSSGSEQGTSSDCSTHVEEESLYCQSQELKIKAEASRNVAFVEFLKRQKYEAIAIEAAEKVKDLELACATELKLRREAEDLLRYNMEKHKKLLEEREYMMRQLNNAMSHIALLDKSAEEANCRYEEAAEELKLVHASIAALWQEKQKIWYQKFEVTRRLEQRILNGEAAANCGEIIEIDDPSRLLDFSLSDLETATCNFSESFKIGYGGYGSVYKGEMLDRTVAIKKLHLHNMQGQTGFQQEVQVLQTVEHPHMVTLIGICLDAWSLVYEYLPNGSLQDRLSQKSIAHSLNWKARARIIAEIASALFFLHTSEPEIVHGNLKPENILFSSELSCKISDYGICKMVPDGTLQCPSFRQYAEPNGAFPHKDPEFCRTGILTPSSDIYSFGLIILQLLTGRTPSGMTTEVLKALLCGKLASVLDSFAGEWPSFVARRLVELGLQCSQLNSRDRPKLTSSLVKELERLHLLEERPVPSFFLCPILQEIMHDPQVAADGFTYEGEALRGWLKYGRETSPMTNLKLSHLHLTPNHALRFAIQEWLCKS